MHETSLVKLILESNVINFALGLTLVLFFLLKFLPKSSSERKKELEKEIEAAHKAKLEAEAKLKEIEEAIEKSKIEAQSIINTAKSTATSLKDQIINEAKVEVERLNANAAREIDLQKTLAITSIKKEIAQKAFEITETNIRNKKDEINQLIQNKIKQELASIRQ